MQRWRRMIILSMSLILSSCAAAQDMQQPTAQPVAVTATILAPLPAIPTPVAVSPSPTPQLPPTPPAVLSSVFTDRLPIDLPWIFGSLDTIGPHHLMAIAPTGELLILQEPVQQIIYRPGQTPFVLHSARETAIVGDPLTGRQQTFSLGRGDFVYSTFSAPDGHNLLFIMQHPSGGVYSIQALDFETGTIAAMPILVGDPAIWDFPQIVAWHTNDLYISTHSSATRLLWWLRLDMPEAPPEGVLRMGNGGSLWRDSAIHTILYSKELGSHPMMAIDLTTQKVTPFTGSHDTMVPIDQVPPTMRLPGSDYAFEVVYTP